MRLLRFVLRRTFLSWVALRRRCIFWVTLRWPFVFRFALRQFALWWLTLLRLTLRKPDALFRPPVRRLPALLLPSRVPANGLLWRLPFGVRMSAIFLRPLSERRLRPGLRPELRPSLRAAMRTVVRFSVWMSLRPVLWAGLRSRVRLWHARLWHAGLWGGRLW